MQLEEQIVDELQWRTCVCEVLSPSWNMWLSVPPVVGAQVVSRPPVQLDHPLSHCTALPWPALTRSTFDSGAARAIRTACQQ